MAVPTTFDPGSGVRPPRRPLRQRHWPWRTPRPNVLIIGAQKGGTSWMHRVLQEHPQVLLAEPKELHFLSDEGVHDELAILREVYAPENARLATLLGRDPWPTTGGP